MTDLVKEFTKDDLRLALRLSAAELNVSLHSSKINSLVNHIFIHLKSFHNPQDSYLTISDYQL